VATIMCKRDTLVRICTNAEQNYVMVADCTVSCIAFVSAYGGIPRTVWLVCMKLTKYSFSGNKGFPDGGYLRHVGSPVCSHGQSCQIKQWWCPNCISLMRTCHLDNSSECL
jgi:hypothetical protein